MTVPLPLRGAITDVRGFSDTSRWHVIRTRSPSGGPPPHDADAALIRTSEDVDAAIASGFTSGVIVGGAVDAARVSPNALRDLMVLPSRCDYLADGDVLGFHASSRHYRTLYRRSSTHNSFLVTERCNHYCLMCSQPPRDVDDGWIMDEIKAALPLVDPATKVLGFTGGEPLLDWQSFIGVLEACSDLLPSTAVHVLTNGRGFARREVVSAWADVRHPSLTAGIPIYAAVDHVHDYVVQSHGAFDETVLGVLKLKDRGQRVEIRVVLHAITAPRIVETCRWLARNLPFVDHVALMGLENTGFALANAGVLWIDPLDYRENLAEGVDVLATAGVAVSVYNLPRCVLARSTWPFAAQSISDWKNGYLEQCDRCVERPQCSGFFTTGRPRHSRAIAPILATAS
ncbi:His-Xaa-Ser system radical SAM maturase HxsC [Rhodopseudomonas palustris]|uniref:His-Xaa-Ser system radical SAM maturase HxsC n=1 Tax=Rhodopseudomonas palustris TaxID=1076 RepID=UPI0020CD221B|nr:His-Xaa-Ser system radical SAM maturase HxsC [Rhodopseudomonas palustris]MCP9628022.1 His-Xaa-Ser system radical SAM maturase HxsC [Rhodopseudomonas palustris]